MYIYLYMYIYIYTNNAWVCTSYLMHGKQISAPVLLACRKNFAMPKLNGPRLVLELQHGSPSIHLQGEQPDNLEAVPDAAALWLKLDQ